MGSRIWDSWVQCMTVAVNLVQYSVQCSAQGSVQCAERCSVKAFSRGQSKGQVEFSTELGPCSLTVCRGLSSIQTRCWCMCVCAGSLEVQQGFLVSTQNA